MDDVLVCAPNDDLLSHVLDLTIDSLVAAGFKLQEEKIQRMLPWKYLGLEIGHGVVYEAWQKLDFTWYLDNRVFLFDHNFDYQDL
ncbi:hypothetical protein DUI87_28340 [Hirundo rustica rustica]|uniref:ribonuclease H n=1 Tax=Hirundo rustica rustica TaxID=333673 RepID=A0A3M0J900_HIRRU|nr:hypothetical protein DUI87_28340 [Hirundo rustica rustica]